MALELPGDPRRVQERPGEPRRAQEPPGELKRAQELLGEPKSSEELRALSLKLRAELRALRSKHRA